MLHEQWKALDLDTKIEYENKAHEENVRRLKEMEECHVCDKQNDKETKQLFR